MSSLIPESPRKRTIFFVIIIGGPLATMAMLGIMIIERIPQEPDSPTEPPTEPPQVPTPKPPTEPPIEPHRDPNSEEKPVANEYYNFQFSKASESNWILLPSVELELLRNPIALPNEVAVFELKHRDLLGEREKRIEIVIYEPNESSIKDNIQWLVTTYSLFGVKDIVPNFIAGDKSKDMFYFSKCSLDPLELEKCERHGFIDVYKSDDRLYVIHTWLDRKEGDQRSIVMLDDILEIMNSFEIINN